jgi:hypothetical protein
MASDSEVRLTGFRSLMLLRKLSIVSIIQSVAKSASANAPLTGVPEVTTL